MNDYIQYIGLIGFVILCLCQVKLWCNIYHSCGVMWTGFKGLFKKKESQMNWTYKEVSANNTYIEAILTCSYLYYHRPTERVICSDPDFDKICIEALSKWDELEHMHKHLITVGDLEAGTMFGLNKRDYPTIVKVLAMSMARGE